MMLKKERNDADPVRYRGASRDSGGPSQLARGPVKPGLLEAPKPPNIVTRRTRRLSCVHVHVYVNE